MDGATLTIAFRDDSPQAQGSPATTPQGGGSGSTSSHVEDQQRAITQAGGVGQRAQQGYSQATTTSSASAAQTAIATASTVPAATPLPTPIATASQSNSESGLAQSIQRIVAADPKATADEIAKLLGGGVGVREVERMMRPAAPPAEPIPTSPAQPVNSGDDLIFPEDRRRVEADRWIESERQRFAQEAESEAATAHQQREAAARNIPRPPPLNREQILAEGARNAPPLPKVEDVSGQVQSTVNAISHFAHMAGPLGSAVAGVANSAVALPGIAGALGAAAPGLVAAAPYVGVALAAAAVPTAMVAAANNEANRAISVSREYSPEVIGAEAAANIRQIQADIRSAQRLGDEAARIVDARGRTSTALQGIRDQLSEGPLRDIGNFQNLGATFAESVNKILEAVPDPVKSNATRAILFSTMDMLFPGAGTLLAGSSLLGGLLPTPPQPSMGLVGIIPKTPELPPPFNKGNSRQIEDITTFQAMSLGLAGFSGTRNGR